MKKNNAIIGGKEMAEYLSESHYGRDSLGGCGLFFNTFG
jgi:hypothetical protein